MSETATHTIQAHPPVLLTRARVALSRYALPRYCDIYAYLSNLRAISKMRKLWRDLFDQSPPSTTCALDLSNALANMIDQRLFPIRFEILNDAVYAGHTIDEILNYDVPYDSQGLAWECLELCDLGTSFRPMVAVVAPHVMDGYPRYTPYASQIRHYWQEHGYDAPPTLEWPADACAPSLLSNLPEPFDGLATAWKITMKDNNNVFLDAPNPYWRFEYNIKWYTWTTADLTALAQQYDQAEQSLVQMERYINWFKDHHQTAAETVLDTLINLEDDYQEMIR